MFGFFRRSTPKQTVAQPARPAARRAIRQSIDAAETTTDNARHWAKADSLSADAAASPERRRTLRNRARYEVTNNSFARGISLTLANDTIGTGPTLQLVGDNRTANRDIETAWQQWADAIDLAGKLRTMRLARFSDGEAFAVLGTNPALSTPAKLDLRLYEADQIATPFLTRLDATAVDGMEFDAYGNVTTYHLLPRHPGDTSFPIVNEPTRLPARYVLHDFRPERPGQHRGLPEITPALPLFAYLRRYVLAVVAAAETAADHALVVQSQQPVGDGSDAPEAYDLVELERGMATVLPEGYQLGGFKAEQPTTTHADFVRSILLEIARCLNMPYCVAAGDSSSYNYASGRLDHQTYLKAIEVDRGRIGVSILDRVFAAWLAEHLAAMSGIAAADIDVTRYAHQWFWTGREHVDPEKEAKTATIRLANNTTTLAYEYSRQGRDWETELRQRAKELALIDELGLGLAAAVTINEAREEESNAA